MSAQITAPVRPATAHRWALLVEDVEFLLSVGVPWVDVCARLGRTPGAMIRALYRLGRADLGAACHRATAQRGRGRTYASTPCVAN